MSDVAEPFPPHGPPLTIGQLFTLAVARQSTGRFQEAALLYLQAIAIDPMIAEIHNNLGIAFLKLERFDAATVACSTAILLAPEAAQAYCNLAMAAQSLSQCAAAETAYRRATMIKPDYPHAHKNRGTNLMTLGVFETAAACFRRAIAGRCDFPEAYTGLAQACFNQGLLTEAAAAARRTLRLKPDDSAAFYSLGNALGRSGNTAAALTAYRSGIALQPDAPELYNNISNIFHLQERMAEAVIAEHRALVLNPQYAAAITNLGNAMKMLNRLPEAIYAYHQALTLQPGFAEALSNLGNALVHAGRYEEAVKICHRSTLIGPEYSEAYNNMGNALHALRRIEPAHTLYRQAITLAPSNAGPHNNLGNVMMSLRETERAIRAYRREVVIGSANGHGPDPRVHVNLAMALLMMGQFQEGWIEYDWRWKTRDFRGEVLPSPPPEWCGESLEGRTILLYGEQGFGDALQFCRYATVVAGLGARVLIRVQQPLVRLLATVPGVAAVAGSVAELPAFDFHLPLMSVPRVVGTTLETIPATVPYLHADAVAWRRRLALLAGMKVGLVWAGNPRAFNHEAHLTDRRRSLSLDHYAVLGTIPGVSLISLQLGPAAIQTRSPPPGLRLTDWTAELGDFAETAALVAALDLVITVDTAVAHLAGALGKPVWILSRYDGCWRWLRDRDDTPWYPTARLFRQTDPDEWHSVVARIATALRQRAAAAAGVGAPAS
ncbi:MAG: tetratricopeptide repeat-containing glycosyltransferase family protein [Azospirillaceae bacterium]|nr:tetratricopeptide repeat-containing glycosyltransferase family protein [Azospirillaceae bacterium]